MTIRMAPFHRPKEQSCRWRRATILPSARLLQRLCFQFCPLVLNQVRPLKEPIAILSCPIVDDQGVLGDMWLSKPRHDHFNELEIRLIQQVTNQTAIALRQARLYQAAQTQISELDR